MTVPGGIRVKLALALVAIVGSALLAAYLMVVPQLEERLVQAKLDQMERSAVPTAVSVPSGSLERQFFAEESSIHENARVVVYEVFTRRPTTLFPVADSRSDDSSDVEDDPVAMRAAETEAVTRGRVARGAGDFAEVAVPLPGGPIVLFSTSLADTLAPAQVVKRRLLAATAVALGIAAVLGTFAAALHARRIRRLERAVNRIAQGHFGEPVVDDGNDELGELAQAFERMRVQLAQLDTARKEFVANASHELRTPLFSLAGFLELLTDEELDEQTRRGFLATMREQVDRLTKLATDLLDLSRMDAGRLYVEREEVDLAESARILADELHGLAEAREHLLVADSGEDIWALADEERVLQIGRALGGNALLHTPAGTNVRVRAFSEGGRAALAIEDDGPGVPAEHRGRIFDRFYRVEGDHASGSGLGLAIARELAQLMGGTVELESRPGRTVFTLSLPAVPVADRARELVSA
jgi:two-component system OmpR family sensor kinase